MAETYIIRRGDKEWRLTGENLRFGRHVKPGAPLNSDEMVDDPRMVKVVDDVDGKTVFVVMVTSGKDITTEKK